MSTTTVWVVNSGATIAPAMLFVSYKSLISKKDWIELLLFQKWSRKIAAAAISLARTQKAAGPSEESMWNHPARIVKCKFKDFLATWRYAFNEKTTKKKKTEINKIKN